MNDKTLRDRFRGCLIGQCLGDALGFPVEGAGPARCRDYVEQHVAAWFQGTPPDEAWQGQYTDDSQLARELLASLVENGAWRPEDYARRLGDILADNRVVGRGIATDQAASRLIAGVSWQESGTPTPSAGNGTAMRAAPVGMFFVNDRNSLEKAAVEQGLITHRDSRCSAGSVIIATAAAFVLHNEDFAVTPFVESISRSCAGHSAEFSNLIRKLPEWTAMSPDRAVDAIAAAGKPDGFVESWPGISPFVIPSVLWSLYAFLRNPYDYGGAIETAIAVGGDVDTTAAMTGAISGALVGLEGIPDYLARCVNDAGEYGYDYLTDLADRCYDWLASR